MWSKPNPKPNPGARPCRLPPVGAPAQVKEREPAPVKGKNDKVHPRALSGRPWKRARRANNTAPICFIDGNVMGLKCCSGSPLQRNPCLQVGAFGSDFRRAGLGEVI